eukprot:6197381-Pleurochrysis_carterae.AAC.1
MLYIRMKIRSFPYFNSRKRILDKSHIGATARRQLCMVTPAQQHIAAVLRCAGWARLFGTWRRVVIASRDRAARRHRHRKPAEAVVIALSLEPGA